MKLIRYEGENVTPSDDAILYRTFLSDGLFKAVTPTFTSGAITIPAMRGVICGRDFTTDEEELTGVMAGSGTITGQIYMWIDMEDETYPLSIKIRNSVGSLSDDDINNGGQYYGLEIAQYTANTSEVTGVTFTANVIGSLLSVDDIVNNLTSTSTVLPLSAYQGKVLKTAVDLKATKVTYTASITTTWSGSSAPYTQAVTVTGIDADDNNHTHITPVYSTTNATAILQKTAWNCISKAIVTDNTVTFTCFEDKPVTAIPIVIEVIR